MFIKHLSNLHPLSKTRPLERLVSSAWGALARFGRPMVPTAHVALLHLRILVRQISVTNLVSAIILVSSMHSSDLVSLVVVVIVLVCMLENTSVGTSSPSRFERIGAAAGAVGRGAVGHKAAGLLRLTVASTSVAVAWNVDLLGVALVLHAVGQGLVGKAAAPLAPLSQGPIHYAQRKKKKRVRVG